MAEIGHNRPPDDDDPIERAAALVANANRWISERPEIVDADMAGIAQDFVGQLRANREALEKAMKEERAPYDAMSAAIRIKYRNPLELIGLGLLKMNEKLGPWLKRDQERLDREAAERRRIAEQAKRDANAAIERAVTNPSLEADLEAADATKRAEALDKAATKPPERAGVRGDLSPRRMTMHRRWQAELVDADAALRHFGNAAEVRKAAVDAATKLASELARECKGDPKQCPPGFKFVQIERPQ